MRNSVISPHHPLDLDAQNLAQERRVGGDERALRDPRRFGKPRVVDRKINVANEAIRGLDLVDAGKRKLLQQTILQRSEHPLRAATRLRRVGRNMLNPKPIERPPDLRELALVNRLARLRREEIMTAAVGVEARSQTLGREHFEQAAKRRSRSLFLDQERRVN